MNISKVNEKLSGVARKLVEKKGAGAAAGWMPKYYIGSNENKTLFWVMKGGMPIAQKKSLKDILVSYARLVGKDDNPWAWDYKADKFKRLKDSILAESVELEEATWRGKKIAFAAIFGPFSAGIGRGGVEVSGYAILYLDENDDEIDVESFPNQNAALKKLKQLEKDGVEVSNLS